MIKSRRCPECHELGRYVKLYHTKGYDPRLAAFKCSKCGVYFYCNLGEKEYNDALSKDLSYIVVGAMEDVNRSSSAKAEAMGG